MNIKSRDTPVIILDIQEVFEGQGGGGGDRLPDYNGEYEVTPDEEEQTLFTKNKSMKDDVIIKAIPTYEVSNSTGTTFIIGGM